MYKGNWVGESDGGVREERERERGRERERDDEGGGVPETTREDAAATYAKCNKEATLSAATSGPRWVYKGGPQDLLSLPPSMLWQLAYVRKKDRSFEEASRVISPIQCRYK